MEAFFFLLFPALCPLSSCLYRQYYYVDIYMSWAEAQSYCRENYTDLATIESTEEMNRLIATAKTSPTGVAWIGLYDDINSWRWSLDGSRLYGEKPMYINWNSNEPSDYLSQANCSMFSNGVWDDVNCTALLPFVCYDNRSRKYNMIDQTKTWKEAQSYCRAYYSDLAIIRSQGENSIIDKMVATTQAWIGLYRDGWKWSDGESASSLYWRTGQPDNYGGNEHCAVQVITDEQKWGDIRCDEPLPFVCYAAMCDAPRNKLPWNHPSVAQFILEQVRKQMIQQGMPESTKLSWIKQPNGDFFRVERKKKGE